MLHVLQSVIPSTTTHAELSSQELSITHITYSDEFATRLEKVKKLFMSRQIPVYNPCGYCCMAARF